MNEFYKSVTSNDFLIVNTNSINWIEKPCFMFVYDDVKKTIRKTGPHAIAHKLDSNVDEIEVEGNKYLRIYSSRLDEIRDAVINYFLDNNDSWLMFVRSLERS